MHELIETQEIKKLNEIEPIHYGTIEIQKLRKCIDGSKSIKEYLENKDRYSVYSSVVYRKTPSLNERECLILTYHIPEDNKDGIFVLKLPSNIEQRYDFIGLHVNIVGNVIDLARIDFSLLRRPDNTYIQSLNESGRSTYIPYFPIKITIDLIGSTIDLTSPHPSFESAHSILIGVHCSKLIIPKHKDLTRHYPCFSLHKNLINVNTENLSGYSSCFYQELIFVESEEDKVYKDLQKSITFQDIKTSYNVYSEYNSLISFIKEKSHLADNEAFEKSHVRNTAYQSALRFLLKFIINFEESGIAISIENSKNKSTTEIDTSSLETSEVSKEAMEQALNLGIRTYHTDYSSYINSLNQDLIKYLGVCSHSQVMYACIWKDIDLTSQENNLYLSLYEGEIIITIPKFGIGYHNAPYCSITKNITSVGKDIFDNWENRVIDNWENCVFDDGENFYRIAIKPRNLIEFFKHNPIFNEYHDYLKKHWELRMANDDSSINYDTQFCDILREKGEPVLTPKISYKINELDTFKSSVLQIFNLVRNENLIEAYFNFIKVSLFKVALNIYSHKTKEKSISLYNQCVGIKVSLNHFKTVITEAKSLSTKTVFETEISEGKFIKQFNNFDSRFNDLFIFVERYYLTATNYRELPVLTVDELNILIDNGLNGLMHQETIDKIIASEGNIIDSIESKAKEFKQYVASVQIFVKSLKENDRDKTLRNEQILAQLHKDSKHLNDRLSEIQKSANQALEEYKEEYKKEAERKAGFAFFKAIFNIGKMSVEAYSGNLGKAFKSFKSASKDIREGVNYTKELGKMSKENSIQDYLDYDFKDDSIYLASTSSLLNFEQVRRELLEYDKDLAEKYRKRLESDLNSLGIVIKGIIDIQKLHCKLINENIDLSKKVDSMSQFIEELDQFKDKNDTNKAVEIRNNLMHFDFTNKLLQLYAINTYRVVKEYEYRVSISDFKFTSTNFYSADLSGWKREADLVKSKDEGSRKGNVEKLIEIPAKLSELIDENGLNISYKTILEKFNSDEHFIRVNSIDFGLNLIEFPEDSTAKLKWQSDNTMLDHRPNESDIEKGIWYKIQEYTGTSKVSLSSNNSPTISTTNKFRPTPFSNWNVKLIDSELTMDQDITILIKLNYDYTLI